MKRPAAFRSWRSLRLLWWSLFLFADLLLPLFFEGSQDAAWWMLLICCCITLEEKLFFHDTPPGKSGPLCLGMALFLFLLLLLHPL